MLITRIRKDHRVTAQNAVQTSRFVRGKRVRAARLRKNVAGSFITERIQQCRRPDAGENGVPLRGSLCGRRRSRQALDLTEGRVAMRQTFKALTAALSLASIGLPFTSEASWLSEITGIDIDLNRGTVSVKPPNLGAIPEMIQNLPKDVGQALLNPAAPALASAIRFSKG